jgi:hypothetical protein
MLQKRTALILLLASSGLGAAGLRAADFEIGPGGALDGASAPADRPKPSDFGLPAAEVPVDLEAGDVQTAYSLRKYAMRTDFKFHDGGGILGKAYLGIFSQFFLGGAVELRNFVGSGPVSMSRDDAQLLARLQLLREDNGFPSLAVGWDGPAYEHGEAKGLYVALSKEIPTALGFIQLHAGVNSANVESFVANRDLRASGALTTAFKNVALFTEIDEVLHSLGPRWNAGITGSFDSISLGLEFRDLASPRPNTPVTRLLRVSWNGRF